MLTCVRFVVAKHGAPGSIKLRSGAGMLVRVSASSHNSSASCLLHVTSSSVGTREKRRITTKAGGSFARGVWNICVKLVCTTTGRGPR
jgi:hypothetical protein